VMGPAGRAYDSLAVSAPHFGAPVGCVRRIDVSGGRLGLCYQARAGRACGAGRSAGLGCALLGVLAAAPVLVGADRSGWRPGHGLGMPGWIGLAGIGLVGVLQRYYVAVIPQPVGVCAAGRCGYRPAARWWLRR
jgi:hypothetical protein